MQSCCRSGTAAPSVFTAARKRSRGQGSTLRGSIAACMARRQRTCAVYPASNRGKSRRSAADSATHSDIGKLDWPPKYEIDRVVRIFDPKDRARYGRGENVNHGVSMAAARLETIRALRAHAVAQSLFPPTTLQGAIDRLGFVQADPIRSPARAQDLILRHRVLADFEPAISNGSTRRSKSRKTISTRTAFCRRPCGSCCILERRRRCSALEKKVLETVIKPRRGASDDARSAPRQAPRRQCVGRVFESDDACARVAALAGIAAHRAARERHQGLQSAVPLDVVPPPPDRLRALVMVYARIFAPSPRSRCSRSLRVIASSATRDMRWPS